MVRVVAWGRREGRWQRGGGGITIACAILTLLAATQNGIVAAEFGVVACVPRTDIWQPAIGVERLIALSTVVKKAFKIGNSKKSDKARCERYWLKRLTWVYRFSKIRTGLTD